MDTETMVKDIRFILRLTNEVFDAEIKALVEACKQDLKIAGVVSLETSNPLFFQAVTLYCKGFFGFADMGDKYINSYESLKTVLALTYGVPVQGGESSV